MHAANAHAALAWQCAASHASSIRSASLGRSAAYPSTTPPSPAQLSTVGEIELRYETASTLMLRGVLNKSNPTHRALLRSSRDPGEWVEGGTRVWCTLFDYRMRVQSAGCKGSWLVPHGWR